MKIQTGALEDLTSLRALPGPEVLDCCGNNQYACRLKDLSTPLKGLKLTALNCSVRPFSDLSPLEGHAADVSQLRTHLRFGPLAASRHETGQLLLHFTVSDLSPLQGMPLQYTFMPIYPGRRPVAAQGRTVAGLQFYAAFPTCRRWRVSPLLRLNSRFRCFPTCRPLKERRWKHCSAAARKSATCRRSRECRSKRFKKTSSRTRAAIIHSIKTLGEVNDKPAAEFWKNPTAKPTFPPLDEAWVKIVRDLPAEKQVEEVAAELKRRNPGFDGNVTPHFAYNTVAALEFNPKDVADLTPLKALPALKTLFVSSSGGKCQLSDLSPIKDLKLTNLECNLTAVSDLSPLKNMKLTALHCTGDPITDLSPLKGMPLTALDCYKTLVSDLSPLEGAKLTFLNCGQTRMTDLSALRGLPLTYLACFNLPISDLSPLKGMKLTFLSLRQHSSIGSVAVDWDAADRPKLHKH